MSLVQVRRRGTPNRTAVCNTKIEFWKTARNVHIWWVGVDHTADLQVSVMAGVAGGRSAVLRGKAVEWVAAVVVVALALLGSAAAVKRPHIVL